LQPADEFEKWQNHSLQVHHYIRWRMGFQGKIVISPFVVPSASQHWLEQSLEMHLCIAMITVAKFILVITRFWIFSASPVLLKYSL